jgi:glycosyltransferase involved in cell wall biosynthesis
MSVMRIVLLSHPSFLPSQSMPRFVRMLKASYEARGHHVEVWSPRPRAFNWVPRGRLSKWAGYVDQYMFFPFVVRQRLKRAPRDTLFVFCDQALGPWVPLARNHHHVVHVHDLLALRSALGDVPENPTSLTGRLYQRYIRRGFRQGRHFISVSNKTRDDLHRFGGVNASMSEVVYNGMNFAYAPLSPAESLAILQAIQLPAPVPVAGLILHVGGGQWYKNLPGVIAMYAKYASRTTQPLPLWCVSPEPGAAIKAAMSSVPPRGRVVFVNSVSSAELQALYALSRALLFPSLAEGFGWPLVEAQACGCPVITTDEPPMTEVAGPAAVYLPRLMSAADLEAWSIPAAQSLHDLLAEDAAAQSRRKGAGVNWVRRFDAEKAIEQYLAIYQRILDAPTTRDAGVEKTQSVQA